MTKIQTFGTKTRLKNNESLTFGREIETAIEAKGDDTLEITDIFPDYKAKLQAFDDSIVNVAKSSITEQMTTGNKQRGNLHVAILIEIRNGLRHFDQDKRDGALRLSVLADTFTGAQRRSFDDQTSFINNFLQELASDKYKADATLLGLDGWIAELKKANDLCAELTSKRSKEHSEKSGKGSTEMTRPIYEKAYNALVEKLNALALVKGDDKYAELFAWWNARIDHYRVVISDSLGAGKGGQAPELPARHHREEVAVATVLKLNRRLGLIRGVGGGREVSACIFDTNLIFHIMFFMCYFCDSQ